MAGTIPCSRNAHDKNVLVRRAQLGSSQPPPSEKVGEKRIKFLVLLKVDLALPPLVGDAPLPKLGNADMRCATGNHNQCKFQLSN
jgi:hypothetical protein